LLALPKESSSFPEASMGIKNNQLQDFAEYRSLNNWQMLPEVLASAPTACDL